MAVAVAAAVAVVVVFFVFFFFFSGGGRLRSVVRGEKECMSKQWLRSILLVRGKNTAVHTERVTSGDSGQACLL